MAKKLFIVALGALLLVAFTAPVMANSKVDFKGQYRARYFYKYNTNLGDGDENAPNSALGYFDQRFRFGAKFMPSDKLSFNLDLQAIEQNKWGTQPSGVEWSGYPGSTVTTGVDANGDPVTVDMSGVDYDSSIEIRFAYLTYVTQYGVFSVGRMPGGFAGLSVLGYGGDSWEGFIWPFDAYAPRQRIKYTLPMGNFTLVAVYEKSMENEVYANFKSDQDVDTFAVMPIFKWATGSANALLAYKRDRSVDAFDTDAFVFNPALIQNFGPFGIHFELEYLLGTMESTVDGVDDIDLSGLGIYLDGQYTYGMGNVALWGLYVSGDDDPTDTDVEDATDVGGDWYPLQVEAFGLGQTYAGNTWQIGMWWDHNVTEDIMLHAALGYLNFVETADDVDEHYGTELDFGVRFQLTSGLTFKTIAGYMAPGNFHEDTLGYDPDGVFVWWNKIQIDF